MDLSTKEQKQCNAVHLPNATVCALLSSALQSSSTVPLCSGGSSIPHIIHQSWKKNELPIHFFTWSKSWKDQNPDWEYRFWTDEDNRNLVKKHYPWVLETFDAFPHPIMRADTVRYMYMHRFGGVYADLDTWAMRPITNLTESMRECRGEEAVVAMMSEDVNFEHNIPNAWMASSPGHQFWLFLVQVVQERFKQSIQLKEERDKKRKDEERYPENKNDDENKNVEGDKVDTDMGAEVATGPVVLKEAYDTWQCMLSEERARMRTMPAGENASVHILMPMLSRSGAIAGRCHGGRMRRTRRRGHGRVEATPVAFRSKEDFRFNFFPSKTASLSPPPPFDPQNTVKQCPVCPAPKTCPPPPSIPDPGKNAFCLGSMQRCNSVGLPADTLCRLLTDVINSNYTADVCATGGTSIPHIIHQSYKSTALPENFATWSQSWKDTHPDWQYKFWSDADNDNLISTHYEWLNDTYSKLPQAIYKADLVRYLYMLKEGGVYADMDTWLMRKLDTLTEGFDACVGQKAILAMMSTDIYFQHNIPNAWMASSPGHPFWMFVVRVIQERYTDILTKQARGDTSSNLGVEGITGPIVLKEAYDTWKCTFDDDKAKVHVLDPGYVFVSNWNNKEEADYFSQKCNGSKITEERQQKRCLKAFPNAHVLTFWTHTWGR
ncbi:putative Inositol phosphoceramide mannosyltransferase 2 [Nannochloris sp. 'desiccata']|nr:putative Inositol phosphoceramide mannosyltransferase 2 [Chlorella desiccata (nom. nud.)]